MLEPGDNGQPERIANVSKRIADIEERRRELLASLTKDGIPTFARPTTIDRKYTDAWDEYHSLGDGLLLAQQELTSLLLASLSESSRRLEVLTGIMSETARTQAQTAERTERSSLRLERFTGALLILTAVLAVVGSGSYFLQAEIAIGIGGSGALAWATIGVFAVLGLVLVAFWRLARRYRQPEPAPAPPAAPVEAQGAQLVALTTEGEKLWDYFVDSNNYLVQQFGTMIVGIGALFFAYGQTYGLFATRMIIGMVGLGSSLIMVMFFHNSQMDRKGVEDELKGTDLMTRYKRIVQWRQEGINKFLYFRATRLIKYGAGLLAVVWAMIFTRDLGLVSGFSLNFFVYFWTGVALASVMGGATVVQKYRDMHGNA